MVQRIQIKDFLTLISVTCRTTLATAKRLSFTVVHEDFTIAGYANLVTILEFAEPRFIDRKLAPNDAAFNLFALKADLFEVLRKTSLTLWK